MSDEFTAGGGWMEVVGIEEDWVNFMGWVAWWPASKAGTGGHAENGVRCVWEGGLLPVRVTRHGITYRHRKNYDRWNSLSWIRGRKRSISMPWR